LRIGTWNILKLYRPGASNILEQEMEKVHMDLVVLQEIKWLGNCTLEKKEITSDKPEGRRRVGRPKLRWMNGRSNEGCRETGSQKLEEQGQE
jgi:hypothetical protein